MQATVTKVTPFVSGRDGKPYRLVCFKLEDGGSAITYIGETMRNYTEWKNNLTVGTVLEGLRLREGSKGKLIDADSHPKPVKPRGLIQQQLF